MPQRETLPAHLTCCFAFLITVLFAGACFVPPLRHGTTGRVSVGLCAPHAGAQGLVRDILSRIANRCHQQIELFASFHFERLCIHRFDWTVISFPPCLGRFKQARGRCRGFCLTAWAVPRGGASQTGSCWRGWAVVSAGKLDVSSASAGADVHGVQIHQIADEMRFADPGQVAVVQGGLTTL